MDPASTDRYPERATKILDRLRWRYPAPGSLIAWEDPWELLVATILAAQCSDARVNLVTPEFFRRWPTPVDLLPSGLEEIENVIRSTGFFRNKAKHLKGSAAMIVQRFNGQVPSRMPDLLQLPGVARKTANIVLSHAFGINEGIAVDTHVKRLSFRFGLTSSKDPQVIEKDLMPLFPQDDWGLLNHILVLFGRDVCRASRPSCQRCPLPDLCPGHGLPPGS